MPASCRILLFLSAITVVGCGSGSAPQSAQTSQTAPVSAAPLFRERSVAQLSRYPHHAPDTTFEMPEIMGSGCSFADLNADGRLDLLLVPGQVSPEQAAEGGEVLTVLLQQSDGSFANVSQEALIRVRGFGMGCYPADIDNDGDLDVLTTSAGGTALFRSERTDGALRFTDVTTPAGLSSSRWSTAAAFVDYDCDGWLDVLVVHYVDYFSGSLCADAAGRRDYCGPHAFSGTADALYRNLGASGQPGVFENVTIAAGLAAAVGKGLGAVCADLNGDRLPDLYVANDMEPNRLWIQSPPGHFTDEGSLRGCAVDLQGRPQASMGTALADLDHDGLEDVFLTHLRGETNTWYRQLGGGVFLDDTVRSGLAEVSRNDTGFGVAARDLDLDGRIDLAVVNGRVMRAPLLPSASGESHWLEYSEPRKVFMGSTDGRFRLPEGVEPFLQQSLVSRGLAAGDVDNDGDVDLLTSAIAAPAQLWENVAVRRGHWISLRVFDAPRQRDAIGARVVVHAGTRRWTAFVVPQTSYLSSHDPRIHVGLGETSVWDAADVYWPDELSGAERFSGGPADQFIELRRGTGRRLSDAELAAGAGRDQP
ncbi:MAG: CRTAC1 family protein [Planctomycetota bacterium]